jgi:DNA repair protein RadC
VAKYSGIKVKHPEDLVGALSAYGNKRQEHFLVITLNTAHKVIKVHLVSKGILNRSIVHPREVFYPAIVDNAAAVILAHNHPSGEIYPSEDDDKLTERLKEAGEILGLLVIDHIILTKNDYYSYTKYSRVL